MYEAFYKLANDPFRLLPDPEICFPHRSCAKAWAYLRYAVKRGEGIVVITGPPGSGKTTLAERLLNELNPSKTVSVKLIANDLNPTDLLRKLAYSFGLPAEGMDRAMLAHRIERYLIELEHGNRQALVLIDEAQTLSHQSLEAMRLLTDLQSRSRPVLQLFLLGQEDLEGVMCAPGMSQFQQRVIASCRLHRMDLPETKAYLEYRLAFADWAGDPSINGSAVMAIYRGSRGLPRHINKICSRLLLHGCTEEKHALKQRDVLTVIQDLRDELLTPMEGESELVVDVAGTTIGSVYELALVPAPRAPVPEKQAPNDAMNALFLAEEQARQPDADATQPLNDDVERGTRLRRTGGRYAYQMGYPRPYRFRRWVHRLTQLPGGALARIRKWAPLLADQLMSAGRMATSKAKQLGQLAGGWVRGRTPVPGVLNERMRSLPNAAIVGVGGLLVFGLAFATWNNDADTEQSLARDEIREPQPQGSAFLKDEVVQTGPPVLDGAQQYLDVTSIPPAQSGMVSTQADSSADITQDAVRPESLNRHDGLNAETEQALLGQVSDNATDRLVVEAAQAASTRDTGSPSVKLPETGGVSVQGTVVTVAVSDEERPGTDVDGANSRFGSGQMDGSQPSDLTTDHPGDDEKIASNLMVASRELRGYSDDLAPTTADASESGSSAVAGTPLVGAPLVDQAPVPATEAVITTTEIGNDMVALNVKEASLTDQAEVELQVLKQREIEQALALAEVAMDNDHLLTPVDNSAYGHYQRVLEIDWQNEDARAGMGRIAARYRVLAKWALDRKYFEKSGRYIDRGLRVDSDNVQLLALRGQLNEAIAEVEAAELEAAKPSRMALEMEQPNPVVEPPKPRESGFNSWMRAADGL